MKSHRDAKRVRRAVLADTDNVAQQRRSIRKTLSSEIAAHLALGMFAGNDAAKYFEHDAIADGQRTVGLLGREPIHLGIGASAQHFALGSRRLEAKQSPGSLNLSRRCQCAHDAVGKCREGKGIGQKTNSSATPHSRQRQPVRQRRRRFVLPKNRHRQKPATVRSRVVTSISVKRISRSLSPILA